MDSAVNCPEGERYVWTTDCLGTLLDEIGRQKQREQRRDGFVRSHHGSARERGSEGGQKRGFVK